MNARHLMIPGLSAAHLDQDRLSAFRDFVPRQRTHLVCSFPPTISAVETTLCTGVPPVQHGVLFPDEAASVPDQLGPRHDRLDHLLEDAGSGFAELDGALREVLGSVTREELLIVSGAPIPTRPHRIIDGTPEAPEGFRIRLDDAFALCTPDRPDAELPSAVIDTWLLTPGIERVLAPVDESAAAWMAPRDRGWILVAEPGWGFREAPALYGHREPERGSGGVLLAFGPEWPLGWPDSVHDWRVAPTLLAACGESWDACFDRPLAGADVLGS